MVCLWCPCLCFLLPQCLCHLHWEKHRLACWSLQVGITCSVYTDVSLYLNWFSELCLHCICYVIQPIAPCINHLLLWYLLLRYMDKLPNYKIFAKLRVFARPQPKASILSQMTRYFPSILLLIIPNKLMAKYPKPNFFYSVLMVKGCGLCKTL